jgi:hypothetical protein
MKCHNFALFDGLFPLIYLLGLSLLSLENILKRHSQSASCARELPEYYAVRSESLCALRLRYVDLVISIEVAVKVCCCFTVFIC